MAVNSRVIESVRDFFYPGERGVGIEHPDIEAEALDYRLKIALVHTHRTLLALDGRKPNPWIISVIPVNLIHPLRETLEGWKDSEETSINFPYVFEGENLENVGLLTKEVSYTSVEKEVKLKYGLVAVPLGKDKTTPLTLREMRDLVSPTTFNYDGRIDTAPPSYRPVLAGTYGLPDLTEWENYIPILIRYSSTDPRSCLRLLSLFNALNEKLKKDKLYLREPEEVAVLPAREHVFPVTNGHMNGITTNGKTPVSTVADRLLALGFAYSPT